MLDEIKMPGISFGVLFLLTFTIALLSAGSYLIQPILPVIGQALALKEWTGLTVSLGQIGFCFGLIFIAPLGDLIENRKLILSLLFGSMIAFAVSAITTSPVFFLVACFLIGAMSTTVQILIPFAAFCATREKQGQIIGLLTSGLLMGILLSRPLSSVVTYYLGWRALYSIISILILLISMLLFYFLPKRQPLSECKSYGNLLASLGTILKNTPKLRVLAICQTFLFCAFSLFWASVPFELAHFYGFNQLDIGLFALIGVGGAVSSLFAGKIRVHLSFFRVLAAVIAGASFLAMGSTNLMLLFVAAFAMDAAVQLSHLLTQRLIIAISPEKATRFNALYVATFFIGGSIGSAIAIPLYLNFGWRVIASIGFTLAMATLTFNMIYFLRKQIHMQEGGDSA